MDDCLSVHHGGFQPCRCHAVGDRNRHETAVNFYDQPVVHAKITGPIILFSTEEGKPRLSMVQWKKHRIALLARVNEQKFLLKRNYREPWAFWAVPTFSPPIDLCKDTPQNT